MIGGQIIRKITRDTGIPLYLVEKDYVLGWLLYGVAKSSVGKRLIFKGGTSLSKMYFPQVWRISEDLDFTLASPITDWERFVSEFYGRIPDSLRDGAGINCQVDGKPHHSDEFFTCTMKYGGPIGNGKIKIHVTTEAEVGPITAMKMPRIPAEYEYPDFHVTTYTLENILAEKLRSMIQRRRIRDYYDAWRLYRNGVVTSPGISLFLKKCKSKKITYSRIGQLFPDDIRDTLEPYVGFITCMGDEKIDLDTLLAELRDGLASSGLGS